MHVFRIQSWIKKYYSENKHASNEFFFKGHVGISGMNFLTIFTTIYSIAPKWNVSICLFHSMSSCIEYYCIECFLSSKDLIFGFLPLYLSLRMLFIKFTSCILKRCKWRMKKGQVLFSSALSTNRRLRLRTEESIMENNQQETPWIILCKKFVLLVLFTYYG